MNAAHWHLVVNHLPVVSVLFATAFLLLGIVRKSSGMIKIGMVVSVIVGLTAGAAFLSGDEAHEMLEKWPGIDHKIIHEHEESAETALIASIVLGVIALAALGFNEKKPALKKITPIVALVAAILTSVLMAIAANKGGMIRHPEIRDGAVPPAGQGIIPGGDMDDDN